MRIVGIDPGTNRIGYALIESDGRHPPRLLGAETIVIPSQRPAAESLATLARALAERLERDKPNAVAVETLFFAKNSKTALRVAEARGVILLTARRCVRSIGEYTPLAVKMAVTGYGRADKSQVRRMVRAMLPGARLPAGDDAIDALAIALTALYTKKLLFAGEQHASRRKQ